MLSKSKGKDNYKELFEKYIKEYGDRSREELKLETKTFKTNPELLEDMVNDCISNKEKYETLLSKIDDSSKELLPYKISANLINKAKIGINNREKSRLNRTRIFGMCREMFLRIGEILEQEGKIESKRDIFYLIIDEINDDSLENNYKELIENRKKQYELYKKLPAFSKLIFAGKEFNKVHNSINNEILEKDQDVLTGTPCSNGECEGIAVVVDGTNTQVDVKDKIIIAKMTDPGWVFLISRAKAIISEKGSILSHTAIITRELGIPSIVGVKDLLKNVSTGDKLHINASDGIIKVIK